LAALGERGTPLALMPTRLTSGCWAALVGDLWGMKEDKNQLDSRADSSHCHQPVRGMCRVLGSGCGPVGEADRSHDLKPYCQTLAAECRSQMCEKPWAEDFMKGWDLVG
jgi:hypothetical protein